MKPTTATLVALACALVGLLFLSVSADADTGDSADNPSVYCKDGITLRFTITAPTALKDGEVAVPPVKFLIDWGDGSTCYLSGGDYGDYSETHVYSTTGSYHIEITPMKDGYGYDHIHTYVKMMGFPEVTVHHADGTETVTRLAETDKTTPTGYARFTVADESKASADGKDYTFTGWYLDSGCTVRFEPGSEVRSDIDLYAGFEVTVTGDPADGGNGKQTDWTLWAVVIVIGAVLTLVGLYFCPPVTYIGVAVAVLAAVMVLDCQGLIDLGGISGTIGFKERII